MTARPNRRRGAAALAATAAVCAMTAMTALPAAADDEAIQLSWDGSSYAATTTESFFGAPVVVPGDHAERTLTVRNDGETGGTLSAAITNVDLLEAAAGRDDAFYDEVTVTWNGGSATLAELAASGETPIVETALGRGETAVITLAYDFPAEATSGNRSVVGDREAAFDVSLALGGDATAEPVPEPETSTPAPVGPVADDPDGLAVTGGAPALWLALIGAVLVPAGLLIRRARRGER